jgi:hypothetical protein
VNKKDLRLGTGLLEVAGLHSDSELPLPIVEDNALTAVANAVEMQ